MSYVFDVSEEHNDLLEMDHQLRYYLHGDYKGCNRVDDKGFMIYNVELRDKRYALQFKLMFNATTILWDESDDEEIVTEEELLERGYEVMNFDIQCSKVTDFLAWCKVQKIAVFEEMKFFSGDFEPMKIMVPPGKQVLVKLTWGGA